MACRRRQDGEEALQHHALTNRFKERTDIFPTFAGMQGNFLPRAAFDLNRSPRQPPEPWWVLLLPNAAQP